MQIFVFLILSLPKSIHFVVLTSPEWNTSFRSAASSSLTLSKLHLIKFLEA